MGETTGAPRYLRMSIARWNLDLYSAEAEAIFRQIETEGVAVFREQPGFIGYRLMRSDSATTVAVAEWQSRELGQAGAERYRNGCGPRNHGSARARDACRRDRREVVAAGGTKFMGAPAGMPRVPPCRPTVRCGRGARCARVPPPSWGARRARIRRATWGLQGRRSGRRIKSWRT